MKLLKSHADLHIFDCSLVLSPKNIFFNKNSRKKEECDEDLDMQENSIGKAMYSREKTNKKRNGTACRLQIEGK